MNHSKVAQVRRKFEFLNGTNFLLNIFIFHLLDSELWRMVVRLLALLDGAFEDARGYPARARVLQAHPVDGVDVFDLLAVDESVEPQVESASSICHQLVRCIWKDVGDGLVF